MKIPLAICASLAPTKVMLLVSNTASIANSDGPSGMVGKNVLISRRIRTTPSTSINVRKGCGVDTRLRRFGNCGDDGGNCGDVDVDVAGTGDDDIDPVTTTCEKNVTDTGMSRQSVTLLLA